MTDAIPFAEPVFTEQRSAVITDDGRFRYHLARRWGEGKTLLFVMLNPSSADTNVDDPTVLKCKRFAKINGFTAIEIVNLFAFRTSSPAELAAEGYLIGVLNDAWIKTRAYVVARDGGAVCVAWGVSAGRSGREHAVMTMLRDVGAQPLALKVTKDGHPAHPLYLSSMSALKTFEYAEAAYA